MDTNTNRRTITTLSMLGNAAIIGFILSSVYDIGYYQEIGLKLTTLPTTLSDHMRTCINWLPQIFMLAIGQFFWSVFVTRLEGGLTEEEIITRSKHPNLTKIYRHTPFVLFGIFCFAVVIAANSYYDKVRLILPVPLAIVWLTTAFWCFRHNRVGELFSADFKFITAFAPALCLFIYQTGKNEAHVAKQATTNTSSFTYTDNTKIEFNILRSIDRGFLVYDNRANSTSIILLDSIKEITLNSK
jgi:hypothetical protein